MEVRSDALQSTRSSDHKQLSPPPTQTQFPKTRLQVWFLCVCSSILVWTCLVQLVTFGELWNPHLRTQLTKITHLSLHSQHTLVLPTPSLPVPSPPTLLPARIYKSNGYLKVSCNGGLNQMRAAGEIRSFVSSTNPSPVTIPIQLKSLSTEHILFRKICDMVTVARLLNLTLVVPELDKKSFWADHSNFVDIFDVRHFIDSLRDEVHIIKRLPKKLSQKWTAEVLEMPPVSWSSEKYYLEQVLPLFSKHKIIHFNKTDARLANNRLPIELQKLRCRVNFKALKFTPQIEALGNKLVHTLEERGPFVALHLRYEMDMLAFSGCTRGCSHEEADELKRLRYAYPWWREKELISEERRSQGMCPLTPEETSLILQALGFNKDTQIYIASGEIYGSERRLKSLRAAFPRLVKKEMLLDPGDLQQFHNHSSQMAALDFIVSVASDIFIPTYDGNMAKLVEGHRRYLGFKRTILPDRKQLVQLIDLYQNKTLSWDRFTSAVRTTHRKRVGQPSRRKAIKDKPKEEDYFYANPHECV